MAVIKPNAGARYGAALGAAASAGLLWFPDENGDELARAVLTVVLLYVGVRSLRTGVVVTEADVMYRGYLWSRRVQRRQVRRVTDFPCLVWDSGSGRNRWTLMPCFTYSNRSPQSANLLNRRRVLQLRRALNLRRNGNR